MKNTCETIQNALAEGGSRILKDDASMQEHVGNCSECFAFLECFGEVERTLSSPAPFDAPDALVETVLRRAAENIPQAEQLPVHQTKVHQTKLSASISIVRRIFKGLQEFGFVIAVAAALLVIFFVSGAILDEIGLISVLRYIESSFGALIMLIAMFAAVLLLLTGYVKRFRAAGGLATLAMSMFVMRGFLFTFYNTESVSEFVDGGEDYRHVSSSRFGQISSVLGDASPVQALPEFEAKTKSSESRKPASLASGVVAERANKVDRNTLGIITGYSQPNDLSRPDKAGADGPLKKELESMGGKGYDSLFDSGSLAIDQQSLPPGQFRDSKNFNQPLGDKAPLSRDLDKFSTSQRDRMVEAVRERAAEPALGVELQAGEESVEISGNYDESDDLKARDAEKKQDLTPGRQKRNEAKLTFKDPSGYWSNTYVPGDPVLRWLENSLKSWDRSALKGLTQGPLKLEEAVRQVNQPFDAPKEQGLALYVHADTRAIDAPGRVLLQVGLRGSDRQSGRRPAMNMALVLDARGKTDAETGAMLRAIVQAVAQARDAGDKFRLVVAGKPGAVAVEPADFKYGTLSLTLQNLLLSEAADTGLSIADALKTGIEAVRKSDDPEAPLGTSAVVLITGQPLAEIDKLGDLAHASAVSGIPVSVIGAGNAVKPLELERLALAGQGQRRLLSHASDAKRVVDEELSAVSRTVARAVRVRIKLAEGVKLVDVIGSRRFNETQAARVRKAEKSIDDRLARNFGIQPDRGQDEDGIQIIIPSFYASDSHVILLDLFVPGPGVVAETSIRYKDLVKLGNSSTQATFALQRGTPSAGQLERNVVKNRAAHDLADNLIKAGEALASGQDQKAKELIKSAVELIDKLGRDFGLERDAELLGDRQIISQYLELLERNAMTLPGQRIHLANSLQLAGKHKVIARFT